MSKHATCDYCGLSEHLDESGRMPERWFVVISYDTLPAAERHFDSPACVISALMVAGKLEKMLESRP